MTKTMRRLFSKAALALAARSARHLLTVALIVLTAATATAQGYTLTLNPNHAGAYVNVNEYYDVTTMTLPAADWEDHTFLGWAETASGAVAYHADDVITLTSNKTLYAKWKGDGSFTLSPIGLSSADFDESGFAPLTVTVTNIDFATRTNPMTSEEETAENLTVEVSSGNLTNGTANIPFGIYANDHFGDGVGMDVYFLEAESRALSIYIDPATLAAAAPGTYTCDLSYTCYWGYDGGGAVDGPGGTIPLTLTVTAPAVTYLDADGNEQTTTDYTILTGSEESLAAGTYLVASDITYGQTLTLSGNVTLILKDGCTMNVEPEENYSSGLYVNSGTLDIYGQTDQTGTLAINNNGNVGIYGGALTVNGGNINVNTTGSNCPAIGTYNDLTITGGTVTTNRTILSGHDLTISGGTVSATDPGIGIKCSGTVTISGGTVIANATYEYGDGIYAANVNITGGNVTATGNEAGIYADETLGEEAGTITLGWTKPTDRITASSYNGTVQVASGKKLHNGTDFLGSGTVTAADINGKTLRPAKTATYTTANGTAATADAILLDTGDNSLPAGNYLATGTLNYTHGITLTGNVTLILADNCHMNVGTSGSPISDGCGIESNDDESLTITSESLGDNMGALNVYNSGYNENGILADGLTINGGRITAVSNGNNAVAIASFGDLAINGGTVSATTTNGYAIHADGNYTFSWRTPADRITIGATGLYATAAKTATFTNPMTDGTTAYSTTLTGDELNVLAGKTLQPCVGIAMNASGIMTYASTYALDFNGTLSDADGAELNAYIVSGYSPTSHSITLTAADNVPAETGLLLKGTAGATFYVPVVATDKYWANLLVGVTSSETIVPVTDGDKTNYILAKGKYGIDWYTLSEAGSIGANKAYLQLPTSAANARQLTWVYEDGETTGLIDNGQLTIDNEAGAWYTLDGRKIANGQKPTAKGIYINNGKKIVIK